MKLVASMMVGPGETKRYLPPVLTALSEFCDGVRIRWESGGREESYYGMLQRHPTEPRFLADDESGQFAVKSVAPSFFEHEGRARQELLDWTLEAEPTHILAIDADEFVSDGAAIRVACEANLGNGAWTLAMDEVWATDERHLWTRQDGGWRSHPVPILYRVPERLDGRWRIQDRALACGREPLAVRQLASKATPTGASVLHFGWCNRAERQARYERYAAADGGRFHASSHLQSILAPDRRVRLAKREWPAALAPYKAELLERANREKVAV